jgi:predicted nucleic acid-binding protein
MSDTIVDASVITKWILPEPDSPQADRIISEVGKSGERIIVLDLALVEAANAIWKQHLRGLASAAQARQLLQRLQTISVHVESAQPLIPSGLDIAMKYRRAVYDALFVALAAVLQLPAVTADEPLCRAVSVDFRK